MALALRAKWVCPHFAHTSLRAYVNKARKTLRWARSEECPPMPGRIEDPSRGIHEYRSINGIGVPWLCCVVDHKLRGGEFSSIAATREATTKPTPLWKLISAIAIVRSTTGRFCVRATRCDPRGWCDGLERPSSGAKVSKHMGRVQADYKTHVPLAAPDWHSGNRRNRPIDNLIAQVRHYK